MQEEMFVVKVVALCSKTYVYNHGNTATAYSAYSVPLPKFPEWRLQQMASPKAVNKLYEATKRWLDLKRIVHPESLLMPLFLHAHIHTWFLHAHIHTAHQCS